MQTNSTETRPTVLVIGATGGSGSAFVRVALKRGWPVVALHRRPEEAAKTFASLGPVEWVAGDAMRAEDVTSAARDSRWIFHGANPPGYRNWQNLAVPMLANTIAAAAATRARVLLPGNVYNFGPDAGQSPDEHAPQNPRSTKGLVRVEMERMLRAASFEGVRGLVVRAGDFFGPHAPASWMNNAMVKPGRPLRSVVYPGEHEVAHAWAYLPDLAETFASLVEREHELSGFEVFHFGGHVFERGVEMAEALRRVAGVPDAPIRRMPWGLVRFASPVVPLFRELAEMRYLWRQPLRLDNRRLVAFLGREPHTDLDEALSATLSGLGCLGARSNDVRLAEARG